MIDITNLTEKDIGKWVVYTSFGEKEKGRLKSWNDKTVFVVFKCENKWHRYKDYTGCGTNPEDLEFM